MFKSAVKDGIRMYRIYFTTAADIMGNTIKKYGPDGDEFNIDQSCTLEDVRPLSIIVKEDEIPKWKDFGDGINKAEFIGYYVEPFPDELLKIPSGHV